jgi:hypothetical protein
MFGIRGEISTGMNSSGTTLNRGPRPSTSARGRRTGATDALCFFVEPVLREGCWPFRLLHHLQNLPLPIV